MNDQPKLVPVIFTDHEAALIALCVTKGVLEGFLGSEDYGDAMIIVGKLNEIMEVYE